MTEVACIQQFEGHPAIAGAPIPATPAAEEPSAVSRPSVVRLVPYPVGFLGGLLGTRRAMER